MLTHLYIRDYAIIDSLELEFGPGMTALTGETGAGKSILVEALGLVLGDRADSGVVRHGAERAEISARFDVAAHPETRRWLTERDFEAGDECIIRRVIGADGRSRGYVNGQPVPLATLCELGERLVDIHGQHEHHSLLRADAQRALLDEYAGNEALLARVTERFEAWRERRMRLDALRAAQADREARLDLLRFQVRELEQFAPVAGEYARLEEEHHRLAHAGRLIAAAQRALSLARDEETAASTLLGAARRELESAAALDAALAPIAEAFATALITLEEAASDLRRYLERLEIDPQRQDTVEARIAAAQQLARKHRVTPDELPDTLGKLRAELETLDDIESSLAGLEQDLAKDAEAYLALARELRERRRRAAGELTDKVTAAMHELGMRGGRFEIVLEDAAERGFAPHGLDAIEFRVTANAGQPPRPVAKVASGGELSRISLAIQVIAAKSRTVPAMVFDEVDAGIGGAVAEIVGRKLRALGERCQVLCVTHLPQVASQAHHHVQVSKRTVKGVTKTAVAVLDVEARIEELARMLGGVEITDTTRQHAREMMQRAGK